MPNQLYYANVTHHTVESGNTYSGWFQLEASTIQQAAANAVYAVDANIAVTLTNGTTAYKGLANGAIGVFANASSTLQYVKVYIRDPSASAPFNTYNYVMYVGVTRVPGPPIATYQTRNNFWTIDPNAYNSYGYVTGGNP